MSFKIEEINNFLQIFNESAALIKSSNGCYGVQLMQDANNPNIYFTLSKWQNEEYLNVYRSSELFKTTWSKVKPLFSERAEAWSLIDAIPII